MMEEMRLEIVPATGAPSNLNEIIPRAIFIYEWDLTKGSFGHFSSFYVINILKTSKISIFCKFLQESQIASNM